jgi:predicted DNA-binding protein
MKTSLYIPEELMDRLRVQSKRHQISMSKIVCNAIREEVEFFEENEPIRNRKKKKTA